MKRLLPTCTVIIFAYIPLSAYGQSPNEVQQQTPKLRKIYDHLAAQKEINPNDLSYEEFWWLMHDPSRLETVYNYLKENDKIRAENVDVFRVKMGLGTKEEAELAYGKYLSSLDLDSLIVARAIEGVNNDSLEGASVYSGLAGILANRDHIYGKDILYEAMKGFNKAIKLDRNNPMYRYNRAVLKERLVDYYGAIEDFTEAIKLNPTDGEIFDARAQCFLILGKLEEAKNDFTWAIYLGLESSGIYINRGICRYKLGDKEGGCKDFSKAGELGNKKAYEAIKMYCH